MTTYPLLTPQLRVIYDGVLLYLAAKFFIISVSNTFLPVEELAALAIGQNPTGITLKSKQNLTNPSCTQVGFNSI